MKLEKRETKRQLFICCNERLGREACADKDAEAIVHKIKTYLKEKELWDDYKVTKTGCLGPCAFGVTAVLYPENQLITSIKLTDVDELINLLLND